MTTITYAHITEGPSQFHLGIALLDRETERTVTFTLSGSGDTGSIRITIQGLEYIGRENWNFKGRVRELIWKSFELSDQHGNEVTGTFNTVSKTGVIKIAP
ncbi:hypothetical protein K2X96_03630 [Patescibacteria group bacterium]|nr:hypothetical protein [Patescibacteria group bacterium]